MGDTTANIWYGGRGACPGRAVGSTRYSSCLEMVGSVDTERRAPLPKDSRLILEPNTSDHGPEAPKHRVPT